MKSIRAFRLFRIAAYASLLLALGCLSNAWLLYPLLSNSKITISGVNPWALAPLGLFSICIALVGPVRVGYGSAMIPLQIKKMLRVLGPSLIVGGLSALLAAYVSPKPIVALGWLGMGASAFVCAYWGFYRLSRQLPQTLTLQEMKATIKSANLFGSKSESVVDREYRRWTGGRTEGLAQGSLAIDGVVYSPQGEEHQLSEYFQNDTPLVINFGSYSCPIHRKRLDELNDVVQRWKTKGVNFITVYTAEAHPEDGWHLEGQYKNDAEYNGNDKEFCFLQPTTLEERLIMARFLAEHKMLDMPLLADSMKNTLLQAYNTWPIRLYVVQMGQVIYEGEQGPFGYSPEHLNAFLEES